MKPWQFLAAGSGAMIYLAYIGTYDSFGWLAAAIATGLLAWMTWQVAEQQKTIHELLQIMQERDELGDEKVALIADLAGAGPAWRAQWAIATARVQAKREKGVKND